MSVIAVLNIVVGSIESLAGLFQLVGAFVLMFELLRVGAFAIPLPRVAFSLLILATGAVGITAGIGILALRSWARRLSLVFGGLLILSCAFSFLMAPILASISAYDVGSLSSYDLARFIIFTVTYVVLPVSYALLLFIVFRTRKWKAAFATGSTSQPGDAAPVSDFGGRS